MWSSKRKKNNVLKLHIRFDVETKTILLVIKEILPSPIIIKPAPHKLIAIGKIKVIMSILVLITNSSMLNTKEKKILYIVIVID